MVSAHVMTILPEIALAIFALGSLLYGVFRGEDRQAQVLVQLTVVVLAGLALWIGVKEPGARTAFSEAFIDDGFARFAKVTLLLGAAAMLALGSDYMKRHDLLRFEFPVLICFATLGMLLMVSAGDLMSLYLGLELQSLALYVITAIQRDSVRSTEAGLKYFVLGAMSSGFLLYGASLVYGFTGATSFSAISGVIDRDGVSLSLLLGIVFVCTGLAFKVSAVPFHMWTPDVYQGAPTAVTAFLSAAPKVAAAALFARVLFDAFGDAVRDWQQVLSALSVASMALGAVAAIGQTDIKRLMAYSSISHMGYALMGLAAGTESGVVALLIYLAIYVTMNVGVFAFILNMERDGVDVTDIASLSGYSSIEPARALAFMLLLFSLAGVPPLVGFFGKFYVFVAAVDAGLVWLALVGAVASVVGAFYYLRIIYLMYFGPEGPRMTGKMPLPHALALGACAAAMTLGAVPTVNLFGLPQLATAAAATLVH